MTIVVDLLADHQIDVFRDQIIDIYREAFAGPPYFRPEIEVAAFARALAWHSQREGFRFVAALANTVDRMVGFAYGYTGGPGQWWYDNVARALHAQARAAEEWLVDSFQVVEIAVAPKSQGQGIGGLLHNRLLKGLPHRKAVLSTLRAETVAYRMYRERGWVVLLDRILFPSVERAYRIMGLDLGMPCECIPGESGRGEIR